MAFNPLSLISLLPLIANLFVLGYIAGHRQRTVVRGSYALFALSMSLITLLDFLCHQPFPPGLVSGLIKINGILLYLICFFMLNFIFDLTNRPKKADFALFL